MSNLYGQTLRSSLARASSIPHIRINPDITSEYLEKLLEEKRNLVLNVPAFLICNQLLNQEILRVSELIPSLGFHEFDRLQLGSSNLSNPLDMMPDVAAMCLSPLGGNSGWSPLQHQGFVMQQGPPPFDHRNVATASLSSIITRKLLLVDVPVDRFPDFNFVGRLLGPRGNSLKRIEALTGCRVTIRGRGSIKDPNKEECLRGIPGNGHLNEPLHVLIEAESPANVVDAQLRQAQEIIEELLKPVGKSRDLYKRQQLRELGMLNSRIGKDILSLVVVCLLADLVQRSAPQCSSFPLA